MAKQLSNLTVEGSVTAKGLTTSSSLSITGSNSPLSLPSGTSGGQSGQFVASAGTASTPVWRYISPTTDFVQYASPSYGQALTYAPVTGGWAWASFISSNGGNVSGNLNVTGTLGLSGASSPLSVNGSVGSSGQVLTSAGAGATPTWTTISSGGVSSVSATAPIASSGGSTPTISIDQTSVYQGNIWTNPNDYTLDFSGSASFQSVLGSTTRAFTMLAGSTYEVELYMQVGQTFISNTTSTVAFQWRTATASGSPTTTVAFFNNFSTSTTQTGTGSVTVQRNAGATGNVIITSVNGTTPNRFAIVQSKGQVRIGGTGTVTISPSLQTSVVTDNGVIVYKNFFFKITRIGSDTMTNLGTWTA